MAKNTRRGASRGSTRGKTASRNSKATQRQVPGWVWLFTGLMVGLFVAFLFHLGKTQMAHPESVHSTVTPPKPVAKADKAAKDKDTAKKGDKDEPKFDFYAVLPKMEVIVPQNERDEERKPAKADSKPAATQHSSISHQASQSTASASSNDSDEQYMLQAGSFRGGDDADRRRAELILKGFEASVQAVSLDNGDTWHRVMIGPYNSVSAMHSAQDKLAANGVETLPIKMKK
ncbi:MAG: SPOR domain-containing protein [Alcanivorax sp.]|nr:SPOR domain-containing protein [Alcanivorax sp.]